MNKHNFIIIIPARKGSKGLPNKHLLKIGKLKLIEYTFLEVSKLKKIKSFVFSNDKTILKLSRKYKINSEINRSSKVSKSTSSMLETLLEFCHKIKKKNIDFNYLILLQPTSPIRTLHDIKKAIQVFIDGNFSSLSSISESLEHPYEALYRQKNYYKFFFEKGKKTTRRQEFDKKSFFLNGSIFIIKKSLILNKKLIDKKNHKYFLMKKVNSFDINDNEDFEIVKRILS